MGVDCKAYIKPIAKIEDILKVTAILLGAEKIIEDNYYNNQSYQTLKLAPGSLMVKVGQMGEIDKDGYTSNFDSFLSVVVNEQFGEKYQVYMQPQTNSKGEMYFSSRSNPIPVALGIRLTEIFGGRFYVSDYDNTVTKKVTSSLWKSFFTDDEDDGFVEKNKFLINLKPLNPKEIMAASNICAYKDDYSESEINEFADRFKKYQIEQFAEKLDSELEAKPAGAKRKI